MIPSENPKRRVSTPTSAAKQASDDILTRIVRFAALAAWSFVAANAWPIVTT
jgi:hypothetical protein